MPAQPQYATGARGAGDRGVKPPAFGKTRVRDAEATRARILKAAVREFARHGYAGARGERIAKTARSSERMVYYYFANKEGLFRAALETVYASLRDAERTVHLDDEDPLAALESFCRFVWDYYLQHPEFIGLVNTENLQQARHLRRSPRLGELVSPVVGLLAELLERGQRAGALGAGRHALVALGRAPDRHPEAREAIAHAQHQLAQRDIECEQHAGQAEHAVD